MTLLALPPGQAHLWHVSLDEVGDPALLASYRAVMSPEETQRHQRYRFERDRLQYLVTRALVRGTLSRYANVDPAAWTFRDNAYGRPEIAGPDGHSALRFNLSNTHGMVVCLVAYGREVGVDVEDTCRLSQTSEIADRFFAPAEVAALRALPVSQQRHRFFEYWTLKEAYIKARGMGLAIPLEKFAFLLEPGSPVRIVIDPSLGDDATRWQFAQFALSPRHTSAAAVERVGHANVEWAVRRTIPLTDSP